MDFTKNFDQLDSLKLMLQTKGIDFLLNIAAALAIFLIGRIAARLLARTISRLLERSGTDSTLVRFLNNLVYAVLLLFIIVMALERVGVNTTSFAAIIGAAGLAIGLALQGSLANFAAGVMIIMLRHFKVGDRIEAGGAAGVVTDIQIFHSVLITPEGVKIILPNGSIVAGVIKVHPKTEAEALKKSA